MQASMSFNASTYIFVPRWAYFGFVHQIFQNIFQAYKTFVAFSKVKFNVKKKKIHVFIHLHFNQPCCLMKLFDIQELVGILQSYFEKSFPL